ncbi:MAG: type II toxin-antitoxin system VapC family toxin [Dehalococcoidia bacterium]
MTRYLDSSWWGTRYLREPGFASSESGLGGVETSATSRLSQVEVASLIERALRDRRLRPARAAAAHRAFESDFTDCVVVEVTAEVIERAADLVRRHVISGSDAIHLASALVLAEGLSETLLFVSLDAGQRTAAAAEGFEVVSPIELG